MLESLAQDSASAEEPGENATPPCRGLEMRLLGQMRCNKSAVRGLSFDLQSTAQQMGDFKPTHAREMKWGEKIQQLPWLAFEENYCWTDSVKMLCCVFCSYMQRMLCVYQIGVTATVYLPDVA